MDPVNQAGSQGTIGQAQIFTLNKSREIAANTISTLVNSAVQGAEQARAANPPHLGQSIDVRA